MVDFVLKNSYFKKKTTTKTKIPMKLKLIFRSFDLTRSQSMIRTMAHIKAFRFPSIPPLFFTSPRAYLNCSVVLSQTLSASEKSG